MLLHWSTKRVMKISNQSQLRILIDTHLQISIMVLLEISTELLLHISSSSANIRLYATKNIHYGDSVIVYRDVHWNFHRDAAANTYICIIVSQQINNKLMWQISTMVILQISIVIVLRISTVMLLEISTLPILHLEGKSWCQCQYW